MPDQTVNQYLMPGPFQTLEEVRQYVSGDRIQCLVCGKYYKRLQFMHLLRHDMSGDDYRQTFGIPWGVSLTSAPSREASSILMTPERIEVFKKCKKVLNHVRRPQVPAVRNAWKENAKLGRFLSHEIVTTACAKCGTPLETTALTATQPMHCEKCASPDSLKQRAFQRRKNARLAAEKMAAEERAAGAEKIPVDKLPVAC